MRETKQIKQSPPVKPIYQFYEKLPEEIKQRATHNALPYLSLMDDVQDLEQALREGFDFSSSTEGVNFWENIITKHN